MAATLSATLPATLPATTPSSRSVQAYWQRWRGSLHTRSHRRIRRHQHRCHRRCRRHHHHYHDRCHHRGCHSCGMLAWPVPNFSTRHWSVSGLRVSSSTTQRLLLCRLAVMTVSVITVAGAVTVTAVTVVAGAETCVSDYCRHQRSPSLSPPPVMHVLIVNWIRLGILLGHHSHHRHHRHCRHHRHHRHCRHHRHHPHRR